MGKDKTRDVTTAKPRGFTTAILHSDADAGIEHGALHKPLHLSVAYGYKDARDLAAVFQGAAQGYVYGRQGNPTSGALETKINRMEGGIGTVCFATGMGAIGATLLALLREGDHVLPRKFLVGTSKACRLWLLDRDAFGVEDHRTTLHTTPLICNDAQAFDRRGVWGAISARPDAAAPQGVLVPFWGPVRKRVTAPSQHPRRPRGPVSAGGRAPRAGGALPGARRRRPWVGR